MSGSLTPDRWARVQEALHQALEADPAGREALLRRLRADDPELAGEVTSLLAAEAGGPLGGHPATRSGPALAEYVGPYRILRRLGEGGMGTVYLAERHEAGFCQRVALKLLRAGFLDPRLADHVAHERRILARLEHPNIARLIDGGATPAGQPYLAMEYVEGGTLLEYAARQRLGVRERVRLLIEVCEAVHYAHQQLVVHRDLKPTNVLVGQDGRPRLLDFGVSKLLGADEPAADATRSGPWFTPAYASPEQICGRPVSTLSDVYALGVILYELLSGHLPHEVGHRSPADVVRMVSETDPVRPSARTGDPRLARALRGDLDTIVLKALAKEPARRYASAEQLAEDLRRYLTGRPVRARPDSLGYRTGKFVRRHRTAVAVAAVAVVLLMGGVVVVARQGAIARRERDRAEAARAQSESVTGFLLSLFEVADPGRAPVDTGTARALLREGVARAEALSGQPLVQASMLDALGMVFVNLQQFDRAGDLVTRAWEIRRTHLPADHPDLAVSLTNLARVLRVRGQFADAEARLNEALAIRIRVHGRQHPSVAATYRDLGFLMPYLARDEESLRYYQEALAIDRQVLGDEHAQTAEDLGATGLALRRLGRLADGLAAMERSVALKARALGPDHPETARSRFHLGDLLRLAGRHAEAEQQYRLGIEIRQRVLGRDDIGLVHGLENLAALLGEQDRGAEAEALLREGVRIRRGQLGERTSGYAGSLEQLAGELARQGRLDEALTLQRQGLAITLQVYGEGHNVTAGSMITLSRLLQRAGRLAEAQSLAEEALVVRQRTLPENHALIGLAHLQLAAVLLDRGRPTDAELAGLRGVAVLTAASPAGSRDRRGGHALMAAIYRRLGRLDEARAHQALAEPSEP